MWQRHGEQLLALVEMAVGEVGHVGVHASLPAQDAGEERALLVVLPGDETLEERLATIGQTDGTQRRLTDGGLLTTLHHHGGQLLVVAHEHEAADAVAGQQSDDGGLEYLRGLVDHAEREMLDLEEIRLRRQH